MPLVPWTGSIQRIDTVKSFPPFFGAMSDKRTVSSRRFLSKITAAVADSFGTHPAVFVERRLLKESAGHVLESLYLEYTTDKKEESLSYRIPYEFHLKE